MIYKTSIVVINSDQPGTILNLKEKPEVGKTIIINEQAFEIKEIIELMPPRGGFCFLHVTCTPHKPG